VAYTTIDNSGLFFNTVLYTGTGNAHTVTGVGFQPDWLWQKSRSAGQDPRAFDAVRGGSKLIYPSLNTAESTDSQYITSFNADGFTMGTAGGNANDNNVTYVAWNWKANGSGSSNTAGSINSTVSANTTSGFSIVKWSGSASTATVGHGLGIAPELVFYKGLGTTGWYTYAKHALGSNGAVGKVVVGFLENTAAFTNDTTSFQSTDPSSTLLYVAAGANQSMENVAYCFASVKGFSKMGSFIGNGEPIGDAPFIYTGFKPAFVLIKSSSYAGQHWAMTDNRRLGYNGDSAWLKADESGAELTNLVNPNLLSNGFSVQNNNDIYNKNGQTYIYMAFAESPFVTSTGVPTPAG